MTPEHLEPAAPAAELAPAAAGEQSSTSDEATLDQPATKEPETTDAGHESPTGDEPAVSDDAGASVPPPAGEASAEAPDLRISIRIATAGTDRIAVLAVSTPKTDLISKAIDISEATVEAEVAAALQAIPNLVSEAQARWAATPRNNAYRPAPAPRVRSTATGRATPRPASSAPVPESRVTTYDLRSGAVNVTEGAPAAPAAPAMATTPIAEAGEADRPTSQPSLF